MPRVNAPGFFISTENFLVSVAISKYSSYKYMQDKK